MAGMQVAFCLLAYAAAALMVNGTLSDLDLALLPQRPGPTTRGTEFIFAFMANDEVQSPIDQDALIIITTEEPDPVVVTVEVNPAFYENNTNLDATAFPRIRNQTVARGSSITFPFPVAPLIPGDPPDQDIRVYTIEDALDRNSGIRITTDGGEVSVYGLNNELTSVDAFSVFPCREYPAIVGNYEYVILSAQHQDRDSRLMIVGCQDNTVVTITPLSQLPTIGLTVPPSLGGGQTPRPGVPLIISDLNKLTSIVLNNQEDLSGTKIASDKPIAVFTGHECGDIPTPSVGTCDHLIQQVPPQVTWGRQFFTVPIVGRYSGDHYRVAAATANTQFNVTCRTLTNPTPTTETFTIDFNDDTGSGFEVFNTNIGTTSGDRASRKEDLQWCCIESNNPVLVMQYAQGLTADMTLKDIDVATFGDPFMTIIPPVVQYLNTYTVPTEKRFRESLFDVGFTIAIPRDEVFFRNPTDDGSRILLNDEAIIPDPDEGWIAIFCANGQICGYSARVEHAPDGMITIRHVDPGAAVSAWVYGIAGAVSFGFTAGFKLDGVAFPVVSAENVTVMEMDGVAVVTFTRTGDLLLGSRFNVTLMSGSAISPADYAADYVTSPTNAVRREINATTNEFTMSSNVATITVTFGITMDTILEDTENFFLFLEGTRRVFVLTPVIAVTILDRPLSPIEIGFDPTFYNVAEASGAVMLRIIKSGNISEPVSVDFTTQSGTAVAGLDFAGTFQRVTFEPSETDISVMVSIVSDDQLEFTESFFGLLSNAIGGNVIIVSPNATIDIFDDDRVRVGFDPEVYDVLETDRAVNLTIRKFTPSTLNVSVIFSTLNGTAIAPDDFGEQFQIPVIFQPDEEIQTVQVSVVDSTTAEGREHFFGHLQGEAGELVDVVNNATVNIINVALVDFDPDSYTVNEEDENVKFRIVKRTETFEDIVVLFSTNVSVLDPATSNFDYAAVSDSMVMIPASEDSVHFNVTIQDDVIAENMERFTASLTLPDTSTSSEVVLNISSAVAAIVDNDFVTVELESRSYSVEENITRGVVELVVLKNGINEVDVIIDVNISSGLAQAGLDFRDNMTTTLTFLPCVFASMTVPIIIIDDIIVESTECFEVGLVAGAVSGPRVEFGEVANACVRILDDDAARNQPPYPAVNGTVTVEYENRNLSLEQNPELLEFAHEFRETVLINLTMPINNPEIFREGSNYIINCLPWLMNFSGGSIQWYQSRINPVNGTREAVVEINASTPPVSVEVQGLFDSELFITSTIVSPQQELATAAIYTCEVCINSTVNEVCTDDQCHNASVVTFNIGSPPLIDDTTPNDTSFVEENGIRNYRVGSSPCLSNPPDIIPRTQGQPSPDPESELRIQCDLENAQLTDTSENPPATPGPITRRWYFNGDLIYEAALGAAPTVRSEFLATFPSLNPANNLILYPNQGWITIMTDIEDSLANRTDISFDAVFGNWTCSLSNPLGTAVARFGTILRECAEPVLPTKGPDNVVEVSSGGTIQIGCIGCVVNPPDDPEVSIDCTPVSGTPPFIYNWFSWENDTNILLEETGSTLTVTEEGQYTCQVNNTDRAAFPDNSTTIVRIVPVNFVTTLSNQLGETLTDNGCSRLTIIPAPGNNTFCTLIGDTLNFNCSAVSPGREVLLLTPDGDEIKSNDTVSHSVNVTRMSNGTYSCFLLDDLCDMIGPRISVSVHDAFVTVSPEPTPTVPTGSETPAASNTGTIILAAVVAPAVFIIFVVIAITICCLRRAQKTKKVSTKDISTKGEDTIDTLAMHYQGTQSLASAELMSLPRTLIIPVSQLQLKDALGQGEFGIVYKAFFKRYLNSETEIVAVKTLKGLFTSRDVRGLVEEVLKMQAFQHSHVMSLVGVCLDSGAGPAIVMPYMANGSLLDYLRKERDSLLLGENASPNKVSETQKFLLNVCLQIAEGMEYLAREKVVHRDLSARNCMIDAEGIIKVADFGLSEDIYSTNYYRQGKGQEEMKLPIRWMAVESIMDGIYTEKSDVWSFGVTMWEVYSGGRLPYPGVASPALIRHVASGGRLSKPENTACLDEVYSCMQQCWLKDVDMRPNFHDLVTTISNILESIAGYLGLKRSVSLIKRLKQDYSRSPNPKRQISEMPILGEGEEEEQLEGREGPEKGAGLDSGCGGGEGIKEEEKEANTKIIRGRVMESDKYETTETAI